MLADPHAVIDDQPALAWVAEALARLAVTNVRVLSRTTAFGYGIGNMVALAQRRVHGKLVIQP